MACVNFKPVCGCGYIFKEFIYTPPQPEEIIYADQKLYVPNYDECFHSLRCPKCGEYITNFTIPVFNRNGEIIYKEG